MNTFQMSADGGAAALGMLQRIPQTAEGAQREVVGAVGAAWLGALKVETPIGRGENSPNLVRQYEVEQSYSPQAASYHIQNHTPYLPYVLNGRGPVEARPGGYLRFSVGGVVFFRKRVRAARANNFPPRAKAKVQQQLDTMKARLVASIIRRTRGA